MDVFPKTGHMTIGEDIDLWDFPCTLCHRPYFILVYNVVQVSRKMILIL